MDALRKERIDGTKAIGKDGYRLYPRDGYNALYGDYHVMWYGDPDHIISSWACAAQTGWWAATISPPASHPTHTITNLNNAALPGNANLSSAYVVWRWMDEKAGVDVGTEDFGRIP